MLDPTQHASAPFPVLLVPPGLQPIDLIWDHLERQLTSLVGREARWNARGHHTKLMSQCPLVSHRAFALEEVQQKVESEEPVDSYNQELIIHELLEMHEQEQDIEDPIQSKDRIGVENLTEGLKLIEK
ncbi:hypothetical protein TNCV_4019941 [Trichonephila clavipes]|nr:hypothetical protein TNCV_4019941 [Trichonephila clavipes]